MRFIETLWMVKTKSALMEGCKGAGSARNALKKKEKLRMVPSK